MSVVWPIGLRALELIISSNVFQSDEGVYSVEVTNNNGSSTLHFYLSFTGRDNAPFIYHVFAPEILLQGETVRSSHFQLADCFWKVLGLLWSQLYLLSWYRCIATRIFKSLKIVEVRLIWVRNDFFIPVFKKFVWTFYDELMACIWHPVNCPRASLFLSTLAVYSWHFNWHFNMSVQKGTEHSYFDVTVT